MYSGQIQSTGPRYCPSIEDKVVRFADRERHQVFLEPEGYETSEIYLNGVSTSLPEEVQWKLVRSLKGLENAEIVRPGYAIEYDYVDPTELKPTLETKRSKVSITRDKSTELQVMKKLRLKVWLRLIVFFIL